MKPMPLVHTNALRQLPFSSQVTLGCAPCKMRERQEEANREFAERFGVVRDPRGTRAVR